MIFKVWKKHKLRELKRILRICGWSFHPMLWDQINSGSMCSPTPLKWEKIFWLKKFSLHHSVTTLLHHNVTFRKYLMLCEFEIFAVLPIFGIFEVNNTKNEQKHINITRKLF